MIVGKITKPVSEPAQDSTTKTAGKTGSTSTTKGSSSPK